MLEMTLEYGSILQLTPSEVASSTDSAGILTFINRNGEWIGINTEQAWFWTSEWQMGEHKVNEYLEAGNYETFDSMEEFLDTLKD